MIRIVPLITVIFFLALPACVSTPSPTVNVFRRTVAVDHAAFAACAYKELDRAYPSTIKLTDLRGADTIQIVQEDVSGGLLGSATFRSFEMSVRKAGRGADVEIRGLNTIRGATFYAERTWRDVMPCIRTS